MKRPATTPAGSKAKHWKQARTAMGQATLDTHTTAQLFGTSRQLVTYWQKKIKDLSFYNGTHGGFRGCRFTNAQRLLLCVTLYETAQVDPTTRLQEYVAVVRALGPEYQRVSKEMVCRIFQAWCWSWKQPLFQQLNKYTAQNIAYYNIYLAAMLELDPFRVKFCDEAHFVSKDLQ